MTRRDSTATACGLAAAILCACVAVMVALSRSKPPKSVERQRASSREMLDGHAWWMACRAAATWRSTLRGA